MAEYSRVREVLESDQQQVVNLYLASGWEIIHITKSGEYPLYILGWVYATQSVHPDLNKK